eukprot:2563871-Rhodomonas_salina.2
MHSVSTGYQAVAEWMGTPCGWDRYAVTAKSCTRNHNLHTICSEKAVSCSFVSGWSWPAPLSLQ